MLIWNLQSSVHLKRKHFHPLISAKQEKMALPLGQPRLVGQAHRFGRPSEVSAQKTLKTVGLQHKRADKPKEKQNAKCTQMHYNHSTVHTYFCLCVYLFVHTLRCMLTHRHTLFTPRSAHTHTHTHSLTHKHIQS